MTPTPKLRFVKRSVTAPEFGDNTGRYVHILQQWWEDTSTDVYWINGNPGEWRDVPVEDEK